MLIIRYLKHKKEKKIRLFGSNFVKNNKNSCSFIFENYEYELVEFFELKEYIKVMNLK